MFKINYIKFKNNQLAGLELFKEDNTFDAKINLKNGGSLERLKLQGTNIISDVGLNYNIHFNSAILFPFANRVHKGKYSFKGKDYQLDLNDPTSDNSLHGLVFNKTFEVFKIVDNHYNLSVTIFYEQKQNVQGFPFKFSLFVTYSFYDDYMEMLIKIVNIDHQSFPFTLGWHPYFKTNDSHSSQIKLYRGSEIKFDQNFEYQINPLKTHVIAIYNKSYDHCYFVESDKITFENEDYSFEMLLNNYEHFVQVYTPNNQNYVAIEPQTGPANSLNNGMGLKVLNPQENYQQLWRIQLLETNL